MLEIQYVKEQGVRFFPITHRKAITGLATNTLVLSESVDIDVDINTDGEPITINPVVQNELNALNTHVASIDNSIVQINETLKLKANSGVDGVAYSSHKLQTARRINIAGAVTGNVDFNGTADVTINTTVTHTHSYAGSGSVGGAANSALRLTNARNIALTGVVVGNVNFDGAGNVSLYTSFGTGSTYLPISGGTITGSVTVNGNTGTNGNYYISGQVGYLTWIGGGPPPHTKFLWAW